MATKPFYLNWWFWILLIGVIVIIVGVILLFATDLGVTTWIIIGVGALLLILGIVFMIMYLRRPKPKDDSISSKFSKVPGLAEAAYFREKSGLKAFEERQAANIQQGFQKTKQGIKTGAVALKDYTYGNKAFKSQANLGIATLPLMLNPYTAIPTFQLGTVVAAANTGLSVKRQGKNLFTTDKKVAERQAQRQALQAQQQPYTQQPQYQQQQIQYPQYQQQPYQLQA